MQAGCRLLSPSIAIELWTVPEHLHPVLWCLVDAYFSALAIDEVLAHIAATGTTEGSFWLADEPTARIEIEEILAKQRSI